MSGTTEAFSRVKIDALLKDAGWDLTDGVSVLFEHGLGDGSRADYVLCDRAGRPMAVVEAKRASVDPLAAQDQGRHYAEQLDVPFVFLSNGDEVRFLDRDTDAHARPIATFYSQEDLERRVAARAVRRALSDVPIDRRIVDRRYQLDCVETLSDEVTHGRRKLLVEMATGTGKTRTAAAFIKRLFEAGAVTRVLFLVDRIALAAQAEDAFTDHLRDYPCHVLRPGRGFDRAKRITIATLQTMIAEYGGLSSGYFDLVITDECHRSIYGKWSGVLRHFDGIQLGLTATPCTAEASREAIDPEDGHFVRDTLHRKRPHQGWRVNGRTPWQGSGGVCPAPRRPPPPPNRRNGRPLERPRRHQSTRAAQSGDNRLRTPMPPSSLQCVGMNMQSPRCPVPTTSSFCRPPPGLADHPRSRSHRRLAMDSSTYRKTRADRTTSFLRPPPRGTCSR